MNHDPWKHRNPLEIEAENMRSELVLVFDDHDARRQLLDEYSGIMQEQASVANVRQLKTVGDLLLRNLVVAANSVGDRRTLDYMGDVYKEIIPMAAQLTGTSQSLPDEPMEALRFLQSELNHSEGYTDSFPASSRKPLIRALMSANSTMFERAGGEIYRYSSTGYYIDNIVAAKLQLDPKA